jgi:hypothetical protein
MSQQEQQQEQQQSKSNKDNRLATLLLGYPKSVTIFYSMRFGSTTPLAWCKQYFDLDS